ncbi:MAG: hypothetical protein Q9165_006980 [Trypethelium subeluteriae]
MAVISAESPQTTFAVLGSTGNCGQALIQLLFQREDVKINAYCRNKHKMIRLVSEVIDNKRVQIFEGNIQDANLLADCSRGCKAVFVVASTNDNVPGCHITQDLARSMIKAFEVLRVEFERPVTLPTLSLLSSSTIDDHLSRHMGFFKHIMSRAASHVYEDLRRGEIILRADEDWIKTIYMKPGGLSLDIQHGHELSMDEDETFVSYLDLAAGMIEATEDSSGEFDTKNFSVRNARGKGSARFPKGTPMCICCGLLRHFLPFMHPYHPSNGPV